MELSGNDRRILAALSDNARMPVAELARRVNLSRSTVKQRLERMERSGIIVGYSLRLGDDIERQRLRAIVMIQADPKANASIVRSLRSLEAVRELYAVNGLYDLSATLVVDSTEDLDEALDTLGRLEGVEKTVSSIVLSTKIQR
ncbi:MAG: Lrp/AsnC family transcriptional regulator [Pseudomonadota bacterium]